jgi:hypothetical protein
MQWVVKRSKGVGEQTVGIWGARLANHLIRVHHTVGQSHLHWSSGAYCPNSDLDPDHHAPSHVSESLVPLLPGFQHNVEDEYTSPLMMAHQQYLM